uniref:InlB B-repeat-containing protein n=1 Tax=Candidatus Scatomorpha intestinigallinarum TaxID=2840923 RepID=UPI00402819F8
MKIIQLDDILLAGQEHFLKIRRKQEVDEKMKSKFKKLLATALVLCLVLALLPAAAFADGEHTVTVENNKGTVPANGTVTLQANEGTPYTVSTGHNSFEAAANATITVSVQPNSADYKLDYIKYNGTELPVTNNKATFTMPDNDVILEVVFQHVWSITIDDDIQNGQVACLDSALANEIVTITATPSPGYKLEAFTVYGAGTNGEKDVIQTTPAGENTATFTMPNHAVIVSATFKEVAPVTDTYTIT